MTMAYLALGSNLGDRLGTITAAVVCIGLLPGTRVLAVSEFCETEPIDAPPGSGRFINAAAAVETELPAADLMRALLEIERELGRDRTAAIARNGPRVIDLDLILYGDLAIASADLTVPHPRMAARSFVLEPLAQIAPAARHPVTGRTVQEMLRNLKQGNSGT